MILQTLGSLYPVNRHSKTPTKHKTIKQPLGIAHDSRSSLFFAEDIRRHPLNINRFVGVHN